MQDTLSVLRDRKQARLTSARLVIENDAMEEALASFFDSTWVKYFTDKNLTSIFMANIELWMHLRVVIGWG